MDSYPARRPLLERELLKPGEGRVEPSSPFKMIPRKNRIPRKLFGEIISSRNYLNSGPLTLRIAPSKDVRVAVSVSKKVSKKAVVRNTTRRRIYNILLSSLPHFKPGLYLVVTKPGAEKIKGEQLRKEISNLIRPIIS